MVAPNRENPLRKAVNSGESRGFPDRGQWSPMQSLIVSWGQFPSIQPRPTVGELPTPPEGAPSKKCCPICSARMTYATLKDLACPECRPARPTGRRLSAWQASRKQSVALALVTVVSGFAVMLLALLAWGGRSELDAAFMPVSAPNVWVDAWTSFHEDADEAWHSLPVFVQQAETAFGPLPLSWSQEGKEGALVWVYQDQASQGYLARFLSEDGQRLKGRLDKGEALRLTVEARRLDHQASGLIEIRRVERLGWGKDHREFESPHRSLTPVDSLTASAWLGGADSVVALAQQEEE